MFSAVFSKSYIHTESFSKLSFLDTLIISDGALSLESQELYNAIFLDLFEPVKSVFLPFQFIFYTDSQTTFSIVLQHSPELLLAISDFSSSYINPRVLSYITAAASILFSDFTSTLILNSINMLLLFCFFI
jgi:hypothetical protein